jgi:uncharacterized membrane protein
VLDSVLGALLQGSVVDRRTGKIVEGPGGERVLVSTARWGRHAKREVLHSERNNDQVLEKMKSQEAERPEHAASAGHDHDESRTLLVGMDWLDNNQINLLMAASMAFGGMALASWVWAIPLSSLWT